MSSTGIRDITAEEVAHYREHGWVALKQLISPDLAATLLQRAKELMGADASDHVAREGIDSATNPWQDRHNVIEEDALFASVGLSEMMGANAQRLMRRDIGVLLYNNTVATKIGAKQDTTIPPSPPTPFHQDGATYPMDRAGVVSFWISLDHNTPEMGTPRYVDRSNDLGPLGTAKRNGYVDEGGKFARYPELGELPITEPMDLQPGDAAAHAMYTLHDAPANQGDRPRWAFLIRYVPDDTIYNGAKTDATATMRKIANAGLEPGQPFGGPLYPKVFG